MIASTGQSSLNTMVILSSGVVEYQCIAKTTKFHMHVPVHCLPFKFPRAFLVAVPRRQVLLVEKNKQRKFQGYCLVVSFASYHGRQLLGVGTHLPTDHEKGGGSKDFE